jgi:hypothetical protein
MPIKRKKTRTAAMQIVDSAADESPLGFFIGVSVGAAEADEVTEADEDFWAIVAPGVLAKGVVVIEVIMPVGDIVVADVVRGSVCAVNMFAWWIYISFKIVKYGIMLHYLA